MGNGINIHEDIVYLNKEKQILENLDRKLILFEYLDHYCKGIVVDDKVDSILVFDEFGRNRKIQRKNILDIDVDIYEELKEHMYKYYRQYKYVVSIEDECRFYKRQLEEIKELFSKKYDLYKEYNRELQEIKDETLDVLGRYSYEDIRDKLSSMLNCDIKNYIIDVDERYFLVKITFNRLYTILEEGTFDVKDLKFVDYFDDGGVYIKDSLLLDREARQQAENIYSSVNKTLLEKSKNFKDLNLEIEDRLILGGPIKDLTLEKNYTFRLLKDIVDKEAIDEVISNIADFVNEYIN